MKTLLIILCGISIGCSVSYKTPTAEISVGFTPSVQDYKAVKELW